MCVLWRQTTHGVQRRPETASRTTAKLILMGALAAGLLAAAFLALTTSTVRLSGEIWAAHHEMARIQRANSLLEAEIARLSSIPVLQERSRALGYERAGTLDFIEMGAP